MAEGNSGKRERETKIISVLLCHAEGSSSSTRFLLVMKMEMGFCGFFLESRVVRRIESERGGKPDFSVIQLATAVAHGSIDHIYGTVRYTPGKVSHFCDAVSENLRRYRVGFQQQNSEHSSVSDFGV